MAAVTDEAIVVARKFLEMATAAGVHLERAVLFGVPMFPCAIVF